MMGDKHLTQSHVLSGAWASGQGETLLLLLVLMRKPSCRRWSLTLCLLLTPTLSDLRLCKGRVAVMWRVLQEWGVAGPNKEAGEILHSRGMFPIGNNVPFVDIEFVLPWPFIYSLPCGPAISFCREELPPTLCSIMLGTNQPAASKWEHKWSWPFCGNISLRAPAQMRCSAM